jgi:hypothetical protein
MLRNLENYGIKQARFLPSSRPQSLKMDYTNDIDHNLSENLHKEFEGKVKKQSLNLFAKLLKPTKPITTQNKASQRHTEELVVTVRIPLNLCS